MDRAGDKLSHAHEVMHSISSVKGRKESSEPSLLLALFLPLQPACERLEHHTVNPLGSRKYS